MVMMMVMVVMMFQVESRPGVRGEVRWGGGEGRYRSTFPTRRTLGLGEAIMKWKMVRQWHHYEIEGFMGIGAMMHFGPGETLR